MKWFKFLKPFSFERHCRDMFLVPPFHFSMSLNFPQAYASSFELMWQVESPKSLWRGKALLSLVQSQLIVEQESRLKFQTLKRQRVQSQIPVLFWYAHNEIEQKLDHYKTFALSPAQGITTIDLQNESKALVWLQTSLRVLKASLERCEKDPEVVFQGFISFESGQTEKIRMVIFNMDVTYFFHPDQSLEVVVYDDKSKTHGSAKEPSLSITVRSLKAPFLNELIPILSAWMKCAESEAPKKF
jgi:hypothetical protein